MLTHSSPLHLGPLLACLSCTGAGLAPLGDNTSAAGAVLSVEPTGDIFFGVVPMGERTAERALTILSTGDVPVSIQDITLSAETPPAFWIDPELDLPLVVPAGKTEAVRLFFAPESVGVYNGQVQVDDGGRVVERRLAGEGCDPGNSSTCSG